jgi:glutamate-1-semialdehyde 2,1-aminomutase
MNQAPKDPVALYQNAQRFLVGGVAASARFNPALGRPLMVERGAGARIRGVDGQEYIDYCLSHGATFLGYDHPATRRAIEQALDLGVVCGYETEHQARVAELLCTVIPCAELVRFSNSGSEATQVAIRLARAHTGREKILKFEGHFHGLHDYVLYSAHSEAVPLIDGTYVPPTVESAGVPEAIRDLVIVIPWNDPEALDRALREHGHEIAGVICEPVNYNSGCITPRPGYLQELRRQTSQHGAVLIFDEVLSGFRMALGGAQEHYNVIPDLCCLGKAVANGIGVSIVAGRRDVMEHLAPLGDAAHSGTYSGHLFQLLSVEASIREMSQAGFYERIENLSRRLYDGLSHVFEEAGVTAVVQGLGARFGLIFGVTEARDYRQARAGDPNQLDTFIRGCFARGVYFHSYGRIAIGHHGFSAAHTEADIDETLNRIEEVAREMAYARA